MHRYTKLNQRGFSATEGLLIVVIIAIIGFVGWFVYHSNQQASNTIDTANTANSNAQVVNQTSTKTSQAAGERAKVIATYLLSFNKSNPTTPLKTYVDKHVNDGQFTPNFKTAVDNGSALVLGGAVNPVSCSSSKAPDSFKVASSTLSGSSASVNLDQTITGSTTTSAGPMVTVKYLNNTWSVDQYTCGTTSN